MRRQSKRWFVADLPTPAAVMAVLLLVVLLAFPSLSFPASVASAIPPMGSHRLEDPLSSATAHRGFDPSFGPAGHPLTAPSGPNDWPTFLHDAARSGAALSETNLSVTLAPALTELWSFGTRGPIYGQPTVVGGTVYIGSGDGFEYAINAANGRARWASYLNTSSGGNCSTPRGVSSSATVQGGTLYVGGGGSYWYALNSTTGAVQWQFFTGNDSAGYYDAASPLLYRSSGFVGVSSACDPATVGGALYKVDLASHQATQVFAPVSASADGGSIMASPSVDAALGTIYIATGHSSSSTPSYGESVVALNASTLSVGSAWGVPSSQRVPDGDFLATPTVVPVAGGSTLVIVANKNGELYAFNATNLSLGPLWTDRIAKAGSCAGCGDGSASSATFNGSVLFAAGGSTTIGGVGYRGSVRAIDPVTGAFRWEHGAPGPVLGALAYANGLVIDGAGPTLELLSAATGAVLYSTVLPAPIDGAPSVSNGCLFVGDAAGDVEAFGLPGSRCGSAGPPVWVHLTPSSAPSARSGAAMTWDASAQSIVLFGGVASSAFLGDTWEFHGGNWFPVVTGTSPSARSGAAIAYDARAGGTVLFGGRDSSGYLNDTWLFHGGSWSAFPPGPAPRPRAGATLTPQPGAGSMLLFGGRDGASYLGDTWKLSNLSWSKLSVISSPPPRANASATTLGSNGSVEVIGGENASGALSDAWVFSSGTWLEQSPVNYPTPREGACAGFDPLANSSVLFGGVALPTGPLNDTWYLTPSAGAEVTMGGSNLNRWSAACAFDPSDGYLLLFGGNNRADGAGNGSLGDTWLFHGGSWSAFPPGPAPRPRAGATLTPQPGAGS
ncbi:MAG: PQQ-binding-like beta-propeller repeat protein, partial [Thermoplasmata archaeon]|nr:PQQ-binding-like beta-propeller repeat protein [Thermoplasmata archaeon]